MSKAISVSTGPIFTIFSPSGRYLREFSSYGPVFDFSRDGAKATNSVSYRTCSLGTEESQDLLDRFSHSLYRMVGIEWQMIDPTFFSDILRDVATATDLVAKMGHNYLPPALIAVSFRNGLSLCQCVR